MRANAGCRKSLIAAGSRGRYHQVLLRPADRAAGPTICRIAQAFSGTGDTCVAENAITDEPIARIPWVRLDGILTRGEAE